MISARVENIQPQNIDNPGFNRDKTEYLMFYMGLNGTDKTLMYVDVCLCFLKINSHSFLNVVC